MSEKQFYIFEDNIRGNFGEVDKPLNNTEVVDLLNELSEENEQLRQELKTICNTCCYDCKENWCEK